MGEAPYQEVARLFAMADYFWPTVSARYYMLDLLEVPLTRFLDLVWAWCREVLPAEEWERFTAELEAPMPGNPRKISQTDAVAEGDSFMAAMNTLKRA